MDEKQKPSERWAPLQCLGHVALLFAPIAIGLGVLIAVSSGKDQGVDQVVTSTIQKR